MEGMDGFGKSQHSHWDSIPGSSRPWRVAVPTEPSWPTEKPCTNRTEEVSPKAGLDLLENRQFPAPLGSRPAVLKHPVRILITVSYTSDFLTLSGTVEHLQMVAIPGEAFHTIPSSFGPPEAQVEATFVAGMIIKKKHIETIKTFVNSM
jgi:hypothetical protein